MDELKKIAAKKALDYVLANQTIGVGTGSTVEFFVHLLKKKQQKENLKVKLVSSSLRTLRLLKKLNFKDIIDINDVDKIDLTVDGADEIDLKKNMIKGAGGALFREKVLAKYSDRLIIIADISKMALVLKRALPIEVNPYGYKFVIKEIEKMGFLASLRKAENEIFITDNQMYILDVEKLSYEDPYEVDKNLKKIAGVVETGLFLDFKPLVIFANEKKEIEERN